MKLPSVRIIPVRPVKRRGTRLPVILILLAVSLAACAPDGTALFRKEKCINCHRFKGAGGSIGPDLTDVASRRSDAWIRQQIRDSSVNNPDSTMPGFGHLSDREIKALIQYLNQ